MGFRSLLCSTSMQGLDGGAWRCLRACIVRGPGTTPSHATSCCTPPTVPPPHPPPQEPEALPFCALSYSLVGILSTFLAATPMVRNALIGIVG